MSGEDAIADKHEEVLVVFSDILITRVAMGMLEAAGRVAVPTGEPLQIREGIHTHALSMLGQWGSSGPGTACLVAPSRRPASWKP